ncbi:ICOS ligand-like [Pimephales promelas]|uniref:ICOS ligand-like n=1 Tax=Pimephales promelas TaxID=90988 RepID=UPI0019554983|nr:ICOS ligand-like [Pimephales promelas]
MFNIYELYHGNLIMGCRFIFVFAVLINKVSQETVHREGVTGGSVLLPCSSSEHDHKLQDIDVSWRHNGSENVYDIVKGEYSLEFQDRRYKNRVETFPLEYERGNFSIKLNNLNYTDTGEFNCLISPSNEQKNVVLIIKAGKENKHKQEDQGLDQTTGPHIIYICVGTLLGVILGVIIVLSVACFIHRRKRNAL